MTPKTDNKAEFKKILSSQWTMAFFLMMGSVLYDILLYAQNGSFMNTWGYSFILTVYFVSWLFCLWLGRSVTLFMLVFNFLLFLVFKEYYKLHVIPLKFYVVWDLYREGIVAGFKNHISLIDGQFWSAFVFFILQVLVVVRISFLSLKKACWLLLGGICFSFYFFSQLFIGTEAIFQVLYPSLFLSYQQGMLYKPKWVAELFTDKEAIAIDQVITTGNKEIRIQMETDDIRLSRLPNHIYLVQAESLTTQAVQAKNKDGKPIMPFLTQILFEKQGLFLTDSHHYHCLGSANTDFMMMSGMNLNCTDTHTLVFYSYPPAIYEKIETLGRFFQEKGYQTAFLHGYQAAFFNRGKHYHAMGFDRLIFEPDFNASLPRTVWGVDDLSLLQKAAQITTDHSKTFQFIITAGMHPPYDVLHDISLPILNPMTELENYLNSAYVLDKGLQVLYAQAPNDSLFIVYGDHNVPDIQAFHTPLFVFYKGDNPPVFPVIKEDGFDKTVYFINSLFE